MFEKNDKPLFIVRILLIVMCLIIAIGSVITFIVLCCVDGGENIVIGLIPLFCGPLVAWLMWIFGQLSLNMMCDIKLIRNKLYGESNRPIAPFFTDSEYTEPQPQDADAGKLSALVSELKALKALADDGTITQEEFEKVKAKYLKNI